MAFVDSAVNAFLRRHRFLSTEGTSTPQKRRRIISRDSSWDGTNVPVSRQLSSSVAEVPSNASFMARGPGNLPSSHVNPVRSLGVSGFFVSNVVIEQDNGGDDINGNTWTDPNPGVAFIPETSTRHSCSRTLLSREEECEDEDTTQAAVKFSRITIAAVTSADDKGEAPQWMVDALKVGLVHVVVSLGTH